MDAAPEGGSLHVKKLVSALSLATFVAMLVLPILFAQTTDAVAQSKGRGGANAGCPNGGYVNGKYKCKM
jgi:hypothetical protein